MLRVGKQVLAEVNDAARRTGLRRLGRGAHGRISVSAYQTHTRRSVGDAEIHALLGRMSTTTMGVAFVGATAAITFALDAKVNATAHSRAAIALPPMHTPTVPLNQKRRWHLFDQIGAGSFGTVRIGMCEESGEVAAIKIVEPERRNYDSLEREIAALKLVKALGGHKNIIDLKDVYVEGRKVFLVTELVKGGELFDHIVTCGAFYEDQASAMAKDIGEALSFLHHHGLVHKDVKPENILLTSKHSDKLLSGRDSSGAFVKLVDFGSAGPSSATNASLDDIGTSAYLPPELLQSKMCTTACDMWALGCVLYISLCGAHPFDLEGTASDEEVEFRINHMPVAFDFDAWQNVSNEAKDLITKLLHKDPAQRLTADQLLAHPWIVSHGRAATSATGSPSSQTPTVVAQSHI